jgi:hypothetical protein
MNRFAIQSICALLIIAVLATTSSVFGANWTFNSSGSNERFGWSSGKHESLPDGSAFGSPVVDATGFLFNNTYGDMQFLAQVGGPQTVNAGISVKVNTAGSTPSGAPPIDTITVREYGTWGGNLPDLGVQADFNITEYVTGYVNDTGPINLPPVTFNTDGTWMTQYVFVIGPSNPFGDPWTGSFNGLPVAPLADFKIRVRDLIGAQGTIPGTFIEKTGMQIIVPEPSSLLALLVFGSLVWKRVR